MRLYQYKDGFRYTSDTLFLYDFISSFGAKGRVLDIGAGCGILGLLLARDFKIELTAIEIQSKSYELSIKNANENGIEATIVNGDILDCQIDGFDFIVSNPPFYPDSVQKSSCSKLQSARYSGSMPLHLFLSECKRKLKANGELFFCFDAKRTDEIFAEFAKHKGFRIIAIKFVHAKRDKKSKLILIRAKKNSKNTIEILPPLIVNNNLDYSDEAKEIFAKANTISIDIEA